MEIIITAVAGICVVRFEGDFLCEADHETFREKIHALVDEGKRHVVIELAGVKYINSCGLGSLVCALTTLRKVGGDLRLAGVGEHVRELLEITRLDRTFDIYPSLENALQEYSVQMT
jgi:anti-sigma B factor antagonist